MKRENEWLKKGDERKVRRLISKKSGLASKKIVLENGVVSVNKRNRARILRTLVEGMKVTKHTTLKQTSQREI